jgi:hypothetical protein
VSPLFEAALDATEEAVYNSLLKAVDTTGKRANRSSTPDRVAAGLVSHNMAAELIISATFCHGVTRIKPGHGRTRIHTDQRSPRKNMDQRGSNLATEEHGFTRSDPRTTGQRIPDERSLSQGTSQMLPNTDSLARSSCLL